MLREDQAPSQAELARLDTELHRAETNRLLAARIEFSFACPQTTPQHPFLLLH
ncbi:hypothetical protein HU200_055414 [Digitaria exilis]|uniref:Uncharacterized protein n=1 Tax=Digitaria exilis TaxID=1010633 RepID=A0A835E2X7_9POAL|nr:hypothetical protein HU200_055414 [Digitaria exilis]CAB3472298.1 unnamed protein product [Digitaria exilis]